MIIIDSNEIYQKPLWLDTDFPALIIDNFLTQEEADKLVSEGEEFIKNQSKGKDIIHGGRIMIPWTSDKFHELRKLSINWEIFSKKFTKKAYNIFLKELENLNELSNTSISSINELKKTSINDIKNFKLSSKINFRNLKRKLNKLLDKKIGSIPPSKLFLVALIRLLDSIWRNMNSFIYYLTRKKPLIPLLDYSFSSNGYGREIHRDSDNRLVVILLYLNTLGNDTEGGDLEIYKKNKDDKNFDPQPNKEDCELQYKIKPRRGRILMFINQFNSYHGVSEMLNDKNGRHFIYGGFTYPSSIFINKTRFSNTKFPTEMFIY